MQKEGHLYTANHINSFYPKHNLWFSFGSIVPDLLYYTYFRGHTYEAAKELTFKRIRRLEKKGRLNRRSSFMLGFTMHYIEDFFTYPHNSNFTGNMIEHITYEKNQLSYLKRNRDFFGTYGNISFRSANEVIAWLTNIHDEYLELEPGIPNDLKYIFMSSESIMKYFTRLFIQRELDESEEFMEEAAPVNI